ncbi:putative abc-type nitrate sulfonate bicarbonate transport systems periplasmic components-like protein [Neofusicoccum parvum UCRNP2]|uniref:Putative abc-type nitrate sulfonate bicarbonate transport systems periplasmic components-like protein n=1 Tax=Botryosphaeria parva (strain UCR-NP2) TaxID=1287680 RepID=R1G2W1_BOTPV|nr:putative abc-type nitrate sulfonate bicarbonate transport systems periplasmic components-like protein [Neofusicoccum parvum UCRNP2]
MAQNLRMGYVPEHFSTPLHFAHKHYGLQADLVPFPSGTGHMIQSLQASEIDVGIGLTEGWVAGIGKAAAEKGDARAAGYALVGTYVETPLCWAISAGAKRADVGSVEALRGKKIGVSRIGSGSYVMGFVLADQHGWLSQSEPGRPPFEVVPLNTFAKLREAVNDGTADFFMWEHFTSKRYYDNGEIKRIGEIYTPWPSWHIVARDPQDKRMQTMSDAINKGIQHYKENQQEAIEYISTELDYSAEDAKEWTKTVKFAEEVRGVDPRVVEKTIDILNKAGVLDASKCGVEEMVAIKRAERAR